MASQPPNGPAGKAPASNKAFAHIDLDGHTMPPSPAPSSPSNGRRYALATELVAAADLGRLVSATYPLARYEDAIGHAANAGRRGAIKVCFDLREARR